MKAVLNKTISGIAALLLAVLLMQSMAAPARALESALTPEEQSWIAEHDSLTVGYMNNYLPFSTTDKSGSPSGIVNDYTALMFENIGLSDSLSCKFAGYDDSDDMYDALRRGEIDVAFPVFGDEEYANEKQALFSKDIISISIDLAYRGAYSDKTTSTIAVNRNNQLQWYYTRFYYPGSEILFYDTINECLDAVVSGKAGTTFLNGLRTSALLSGEYSGKLKAARLPHGVEFGFAVREGNAALLSVIDKAISCTDEAAAFTYSFNYIDSVTAYTAKDFLRDNLVWILLAISVFAVITAVAISLKRKAEAELAEAEKEKKRQLEEALTFTGFFLEPYDSAYYIGLRDMSCRIYKRTAELEKHYPIITDYLDSVIEYIDREVHPEDRETLKELMKPERMKDLLSEHSEFSRTFRTVSGGEIRNLRLQVIRGADEDHAAFGFMDITEQVKAVEEQQNRLAEALSMAESANRAKTTFLNSMSHDIRTPMNAIIGFTGLAASHIDNKEQVQEYLGKIGQSSRHLLSLINDVLDMSRIESGKMNLDEKPESLTDIVRTLQDIVQADVNARQHDFSIETVNVNDKDIVCDRLRLNQVLLNILSNSIKYTPKGGTISMRITEKAVKPAGYATYEFCITDNGMGMDEEYLKTIFDPFTRVKSSTVSGIQGTGLGMAITKNIVDMMGGTIDVRSKPGKGTIMTVTFDFRLQESRKDDEQACDAPVNYDFAGKRILLVEDNEMNREIACEVLSEDGFLIDTAEDGDIAVEKIKAAKAGDYDLILMDVQMPRMNGYEATRLIRAMGTEISRIPILAMTANAFEEDRRLALDAGMNEHITKPIDVVRLKETLAKFI